MSSGGGIEPTSNKCNGLATDVRYYGEWMKQQAFERIGHLYPTVQIKEGRSTKEANVIAWKWARTVKCPNPACGCRMPLVNSFVLSKKKGKEAWIRPVYQNGEFRYEVVQDGKPEFDGTVDRRGAKCCCCGTPVDFDYIRNEAKNNRMEADLMAIVAEGNKSRYYISAPEIQKNIADIHYPSNLNITDLPKEALGFRVQNYGMIHHYQLFTPRQLTALMTFSDLVSEAKDEATKDAIRAGLPDDNIALADGGCGARAYGEAIAVYLAFVVDKLADRSSSICSWDSTRDGLRNTFGRQAIPMVWDYAEGNPFCDSSGSYHNMLEWVYKCIEQFPANIPGNARQFDAQSDCGLKNIVISTDPPYYDNIGYADLSDYFYVWMRQSLKNIYPKICRTLQTPKSEELIATPYRHDGDKQKAKDFFEDGMKKACCRMYEMARDDVPVTIYYAYKQQDAETSIDDADETGDSGATASSSKGWETILTAIIEAGFQITGTWPIRTEMTNRSVGLGTNALASSIVLVCRKRSADAPVSTRQQFIRSLNRELGPALAKLQTGNIAPVDMAQAAIGPGMAIYSQYRMIREASGSCMSVHTALQLINQALDKYMNEGGSELDRESQCCIEIYKSSAFNDVDYSVVDNLMRAKGTSLDRLKKAGVIEAKKGIAHLILREELYPIQDSKSILKLPMESKSCLWFVCQTLVHALTLGGRELAAQLLAAISPDIAYHVRELAYCLFHLAEQKNWLDEARKYNDLIFEWNQIVQRMEDVKSVKQPKTLFD